MAINDSQLIQAVTNWQQLRPIDRVKAVLAEQLVCQEDGTPNTIVVKLNNIANRSSAKEMIFLHNHENCGKPHSAISDDADANNPEFQFKALIRLVLNALRPFQESKLIGPEVQLNPDESRQELFISINEK